MPYHFTCCLRPSSASAALIAALMLTACGSTPIDWIVVFDDPAVQARAPRVEGSLLVGGCTGTGDAFVDVAPGMAMNPRELSAGPYGFYARAIDADCNVIAEGCSAQEIPAPSGTVVTTRLVELASPRALCAAAECAAGRCGGGIDAGVDGGPRDSGGFDSGGFDSGGFDSGGFDSGGIDSGGIDAGPRDSGTDPCGNGVRDVGETCDFSVDPCCNMTCTGALVAGTTCRAAADVCDAAEQCDGTRFDCPADRFASGTECRPSGGACDPAESCDGSGAACPTDVRSTAVCRASLGACDPAESCAGGTACPSDVRSTAVCRPSTGACDPAESCSGSGTSCPSDVRNAGRVGLYAADSATNHTNVHSTLVGAGGLASVTIGGPVTDSFTPTLAELMAYDSLFVWGSASWNGNAFGDVLANYIETGRGVVIAVFAQRTGASLGVEGRFATAGYRAYVPGGYNFTALTMVMPPAMPAHPIMAGITRFSGTSIAFHDGAHNPSASLIASFDNGRPAVAAFRPAAGRSALLGFYPITSFWDTTSDGARLMVNALNWAACGP